MRDAASDLATHSDPDSSGSAFSVHSSVSSDDDSYDELSRSRHPSTSEQHSAIRHSEFGHCSNDAYRRTSVYEPGAAIMSHVNPEPPYYILLTAYMSYLILILFGRVRDFLAKRFYPDTFHYLTPGDGYAALNPDLASFYSRRVMTRLDDCISRPITGVPGRIVTLLDRSSPNNNTAIFLTGTRSRALNVSSYNYLGFAQANGPCADVVEEGIRRYGVTTCSVRLEGGTTDLHVQAEALVAKFVGAEDAIIFSMGFATNSTTLPALVGKGCLVVSDELNHASIRVGLRLSGANIRTFKHNDMKSLETVLRQAISQGQPITHSPWKKILLVVEGLYSMEGTLVNLPAIVQLKSRYKFYVYLDEAHSIGALGPHGRGVADYFGIDPATIDILMGTFTKSFGASGGYIAGRRDLISFLRARSQAGHYAESISPPVLAQIIASMSCIMGISPSPMQNGNASSISLPAQEAGVYPGPAPAASLPSWVSLPPQVSNGSEGRIRLRRLAFNARYLSRGLNKLGFIIYGHSDSPIVPLILFHFGKMVLFSRLMLARQTPIAVAIVGYPATPVATGRVRFCVSASHTKQDCDEVLRACDEIGDLLDLKHGQSKNRWSIDEVTKRAVELVKMEDE